MTQYRSRQINLIAPPRYVMTTTTLERTEGLSVLNQAMAAIKEKIEEKRGVFNIQMEVSDLSLCVQTCKSERRTVCCVIIKNVKIIQALAAELI